jgi:hypothetical protein
MADLKTTSKNGDSSFPFLLGTGLQAVGNIMESSAQANASLFSAGEVLRVGLENARLMREQGHMVQSSQQAGFSKAGVELTGSPLAVMAATANIAEKNALKIERDARNRAFQLKRQASQQKTAGYINTATTLLTVAAL